MLARPCDPLAELAVGRQRDPLGIPAVLNVINKGAELLGLHPGFRLALQGSEPLFLLPPPPLDQGPRCRTAS